MGKPGATALMRNLRSEQKIMQDWRLDPTKPLVSVWCLTYNHESYIEDALEGFLIQETDFPFEILIHDDASTDRTANIIQEYEARYPNLIKPIYQTENQYSKGNQPELFNSKRAKGEYIALCEGDDYWIDAKKLQKQVDFLQRNSEFGLVHTDCNFFYQQTGKFEKNVNHNLMKSNELINYNSHFSSKDLFLYLILGKYRIRTATVLYRAIFIKSIPSNPILFLMRDTPLWLDLSQITIFYYLDEITTVYRVLNGSASHPINIKSFLRFKLSESEMRIHYCFKYCYSIPKYTQRRYNDSLLKYITFDRLYIPYYSLIQPSLLTSLYYNVIKFSHLFRQTIKFYYSIRFNIHTKQIITAFKRCFYSIIKLYKSDKK